jgi:hypothetical protein
MSNSRAQILYEKQKCLLSELGIPFLDHWEAYYLSGDKFFEADGRHYNDEINRLMQSWFYRGDMNNLVFVSTMFVAVAIWRLVNNLIKTETMRLAIIIIGIDSWNRQRLCSLLTLLPTAD